jgi:hypothetical protein
MLHGFFEADGHQVTHLKEKFPADISDEDWITALAVEGGWIVLSADNHITKKPILRDLWRNAGLTGFFLKKGWNIPPDQQAQKLIGIFLDIIDVAQTSPAGTTILIPVQAKAKRDFDIK